MSKKRCRCACGYRCGGPGACELFAVDVMLCIEAHYVRDCDHQWDGPHVEIHASWGLSGSSATCSKCGMTAEDHDLAVGP